MIGSMLTPYYADDNLLNILDALCFFVNQQRPCLDLSTRNTFLCSLLQWIMYNDEHMVYVGYKVWEMAYGSNT